MKLEKSKRRIARRATRTVVVQATEVQPGSGVPPSIGVAAYCAVVGEILRERIADGTYVADADGVLRLSDSAESTRGAQ